MVIFIPKIFFFGINIVGVNMTIKSSGSLSISEIRTEFGGASTNIRLTDYYAGNVSGLVPAGTVGFPSGIRTLIPASGPISFSNFYGATKVVTTIFTGNGTYVVPAAVNQVDVLVVGGGGGGGGCFGNIAEGGGGGGAGAVTYRRISVTPGASIGVSVGAGGAGQFGNRGTNGGASSFGGLVVAVGGGGGGGGGSGNRIGSAGGSAGGSHGLGGDVQGGLPVIRSFAGNDGTLGSFGSRGGQGGWFAGGGGGGGAMEAGTPTRNPNEGFTADRGNGGNGIQINFLGSLFAVGGGGGGGARSGAPGSWGIGGFGGGGSGLINGSPNNGQINTGGGGGGAQSLTGNSSGAPGGSGLVVVSTFQSAEPNTIVPVISAGVSNTNFALQPNTACQASISINSNGTITASGSPTTGLFTIGSNAWWTTVPSVGIGNNYWILFDVQTCSEALPISSSVASQQWVSLGVDRSFSAFVDTGFASGAITSAAVIQFLIATAPNSGAVVARGTFTLTVTAEGSSGGPLD
jgi:hypothetical protein